MKLLRNSAIVVIFSLFFPSIILGSYFVYPKLNSGSNSLQLYDSFLDNFVDSRFYFSSFVLSDFDLFIDYGYLLGVDMDKYGELSFSYIERELGIRYADLSYKESSYNISYSYVISIVNLSFGVNIADPVHSRFFQFTKGFLYSFNLGLGLRPADFLLLELGFFNIGKGSSDFPIDIREYFYSSVYMYILDELSLKFSFHLFREYRVMANIFLSYSINSNVALDFVFSNEPFSFAFSTRFNFYLFSLKLSALVKDNVFHGFISFGFVWGASSTSSFRGVAKAEGSGAALSISSDYLVNINTADEEELTSLPGVGSVLSKRIIEHRELYGLFYSKEEITNVAGVGTRAFNRFKDLITIGDIDLSTRLSRLIRWTMKDFIDIGFPPSLSLNLVIYIRNNHPVDDLSLLFAVEGFSKKYLDKLRSKLEEYAVPQHF